MTTPVPDLNSPQRSDVDTFAFTETGPWSLDEPDTLPWRRHLDFIRSSAAREVPRLTRRRRTPPGIRVVTVLRRLLPAIAAWYVGARRRGGAESRADLSTRLRVAAEQLGPTYIKLGQIISSGEGIFPAELVSEFKKCRDQVPAEPFDLVRQVIEEDLAAPLDEIFSHIDREPLAAASIAQVHAATLRSGEDVVVKVQRPSVASMVRHDIAAMAWIAPWLVGRIPVAALANPPALVELFAETISEELDFRLEAENMIDVAAMLVECGQRGWVIPRPHPELVTPRVLVMQRLDGYNFDDIEGMRAAGVDTHEVVRVGMIAFMEGAMLQGIFHGDLHGGNLFVRDDGRLALLDFGITGRLTGKKRQAFLALMMSAATNNVKGQLYALIDLGALPKDTDLDQVIVDLGLDQPPPDPTQLSGDEIVREVQRTIKALLGYGARMPKELMLFVKNLMFLDGAIATLAPDLDLFNEIGYIATHFAMKHGDRIAADIGVDPRTLEIDTDELKTQLGIDPDEYATFTYRDIQKQREVIRSRLEHRAQPRRRRFRR